MHLKRKKSTTSINDEQNSVRELQPLNTGDSDELTSVAVMPSPCRTSSLEESPSQERQQISLALSGGKIITLIK